MWLPHGGSDGGKDQEAWKNTFPLHIRRPPETYASYIVGIHLRKGDGLEEK